MQAFLTAIGTPIARKDAKKLAALLADATTNDALTDLVGRLTSTDVCCSLDLSPSLSINSLVLAEIIVHRGLKKKKRRSLDAFKGSVLAPWDEVIIALVQVRVQLRIPNYQEAYREQAHVVKLRSPSLNPSS